MCTPEDSQELKRARADTIRAWQAYRDALAADLAAANHVLTGLQREQRSKDRRAERLRQGGAGNYLRKWAASHPGETITISGALEWVLAAGWDGDSTIDPQAVVGSALAQLVTRGELYREARGMYRAPRIVTTSLPGLDEGVPGN